MSEREKFYKKCISSFIENKDSSILICGGGEFDKKCFIDLGYTNVTVSNLDTRMKGNEYDPYSWSFQNAENLTYETDSFDYTVIHAAIHHSSSPHRVVTEMYRVAKKGTISFEARDSWTIRLLEKINVSQTYEHAAVYFNDCEFGGVNNTHIPNYVYRWTEREFEKTVNAFSPEYIHKFRYWYGTAFPSTTELEKGNKLKMIVLKVLRPLFSLFTMLMKKQQNLFAFSVMKPETGDMQPWLKEDNGDIKFSREWGKKFYKS